MRCNVWWAHPTPCHDWPLPAECQRHYGHTPFAIYILATYTGAMRIGLDISDLATGRADGTTRYTYELARRLPDIAGGHTWDYFSPAAPTTTFTLRNTPATIHTSPWPKYWTQFRLPRELYRVRPDVLLMPIQQLPYVRPSKLKTVAVIHDLAVHYYPQQFTYKDWALLHIFSAYAARHADHLIAVSQATADDVKKFYGRTRNVHVIHHGVDHDQYTAPTSDDLRDSWEKLREKYPRLNAPYILYVGQIQPRKNLGRLVEAFERIGHTDTDVSLVIAGGHGWLGGPINETIAKSPMRDRIHVLGSVPQSLLRALYWHADVFVLPSLYEGFGMPILEAMACGTPVVTADVSSMPEVAGDAAVLINPHDATSITEGVLQAREHQQKYRELGLARAKEFTWEATAKKTLGVLESV